MHSRKRKIKTRIAPFSSSFSGIAPISAAVSRSAGSWGAVLFPRLAQSPPALWLFSNKIPRGKSGDLRATGLLPCGRAAGVLPVVCRTQFKVEIFV